MKILAFGHKSATGKDTSVNFLVNYFKQKNLGIKVERRAFADKVKNIAYQLYKHHGLQPALYYDLHREARLIKLPGLNLDPVEIWVLIGNKLREIYSETWVDFALLDCSADIVLISDLRYPNEASKILELGGVCVKLNKPDAIIRNTIADNMLNDYPYWYKIINNDGLQNELEVKLVNLISELGWENG